MLSKFYSFLKENKALESFLVECESYIPERNVDEFISRVISSSPASVIRKAFVWEDSEFGNDFWTNLDKKWRNLLQLWELQ